MLRPSTAVFALFALASSPALAQIVTTQQQIVDWNYNGQATANGSGCKPTDTAFIAAGNELTVVFGGMGLQLSGPGANSAIRSCSLVVPAKVKQPEPGTFFYVTQLQETLSYGYVRTSMTSGKISMMSRLFNQPAGSLSLNIPTPGEDPTDAPLIQRDSFSQIIVFNPSGQSCSDDFEGNYVATISATAKRSGATQEILIDVPGQDIRLSAVPFFGTQPCP